MKPELPFAWPLSRRERAPDAPVARPVALDSLALRQPALVAQVHAPPHAPEWAGWLAQIGFLPGEPVMLLARGRPGADPLVVRIGDSTFALRRAEAACVHITPAGRPAT
jgi:ferrous iron transport protein A